MASNKDDQIILRISRDQKDRWKRTADEAGLTLSEWLRIRAEGGTVVSAAPAPRRRAV